jgi:hypothetical protein
MPPYTIYAVTSRPALVWHEKRAKRRKNRGFGTGSVIIPFQLFIPHSSEGGLAIMCACGKLVKMFVEKRPAANRLTQYFRGSKGGENDIVRFVRKWRFSPSSPPHPPQSRYVLSRLHLKPRAGSFPLTAA